MSESLLQVFLGLLVYRICNVNVGLHQEIVDIILRVSALDGVSRVFRLLCLCLAIYPHELSLQLLLLGLLLLLCHLHCRVIEGRACGSSNVEAFLSLHLRMLTQLVRRAGDPLQVVLLGIHCLIGQSRTIRCLPCMHIVRGLNLRWQVAFLLPYSQSYRCRTYCT